MNGTAPGLRSIDWHIIERLTPGKIMT